MINRDLVQQIEDPGFLFPLVRDVTKTNLIHRPTLGEAQTRMNNAFLGLSGWRYRRPTIPPNTSFRKRWRRIFAGLVDELKLCQNSTPGGSSSVESRPNLTSAIASLTSAVNLLASYVKVSDLEAASSPPGRVKSSPSNALSDNGGPLKSYAGAVRSNSTSVSKTSHRPISQSSVTPTRNPSNPTSAPLCCVIRFHGQSPSPHERLLPKVISDAINNRLSRTLSAKGLQVLGSHWNPSGNIILTFPPDTPDELVSEHINIIREALNLSSQTVSRDVPWSKLMLLSVFARSRSEDPVYSNKVLYEALIRNPAIANLKITQKPRWVCSPEEIKGFRSSIVFAFEDPDGSIAKSLLRSHIFMFGSPVRIKHWIEKPQSRQCIKCWGLGHVLSSCRNSIRCCICSKPRPEDKHPSACAICSSEKRSDGTCLHSPHCVNCKGSHPSDNPSCQSRSNFRSPAHVTNPSQSSPDAMLQ
ncbi:hypothetical protein OPQ81_003865 [Rhizoctonia solani]|nr:hypothetical protein OPQ81_003865 [Rhizoctonia solani]